MFRLIGVYSVVLHSWFGKPRYFFIWALLEHLWCDLKIQKVAVLFVAPSWPFLLQSFYSVNHKIILWMEQFIKVLPRWTTEEIHPRVCCYQALFAETMYTCWTRYSHSFHHGILQCCRASLAACLFRNKAAVQVLRAPAYRQTIPPFYF